MHDDEPACRYTEQIADLLDGLLSEGQAQEIGEHLVDCRVCGREYTEMRRLSALLHAADPAAEAAAKARRTADVRAALLARCAADVRTSSAKPPKPVAVIGGRSARKPRSAWLLRGLVPTTAFAAAACVAIAILTGRQTTTQPAATPHSEPSVVAALPAATATQAQTSPQNRTVRPTTVVPPVAIDTVVVGRSSSHPRRIQLASYRRRSRRRPAAMSHPALAAESAPPLLKVRPERVPSAPADGAAPASPSSSHIVIIADGAADRPLKPPTPSITIAAIVDPADPANNSLAVIRSTASAEESMP